MALKFVSDSNEEKLIFAITIQAGHLCALLMKNGVFLVLHLTAGSKDAVNRTTQGLVKNSIDIKEYLIFLIGFEFKPSASGA